MASKTNVEFRVGIIILFGLIILLGSLYWLQGYKLERNATRILVRFHDVGSLAVGDNVTVSGVHEGKVNKLTLTPGGVIVELLIYKDVVLKQDATITIRNLGLMGERYVAISPGQDTVLFNTSQVAEGRYDTGIPEVMGMMGDMISELRNLVHSIKQTIGSDSSLRKFNNTVSNLEEVSHSLSSYLERNKGKLDKTADNFLAASKELNGIFVRNATIVDSSVDRINKVTIQAESLASKLDSLAQSARRFADALDNENGTVRLLLDDRRLYDDLRRTASNLDELVSDIRANPRKYINLKVQLF
jgi:phospholipid/cholesterol/gamma-HCH transport system substrate-binding protein